jgi:carbonic anhydrase/acetyltransferase-like protein (isoleucine patch superfamily)
MIRSFNGKTPVVHPTAYVNEIAYVVGEVEIGEGSAVYPGVVIRGDDGKITIGRDTHVQEVSAVHSYGPSVIGDHVNIGHSAVVHSARIGDRCIIGNHATLLEDVEIGEYCLVGANAMVRRGAKIPPYSFVAGVPAEIRPLSESQKQMLEDSTGGFAELARKYKQEGLE